MRAGGVIDEVVAAARGANAARNGSPENTATELFRGRILGVEMVG
jgi:hypothetical protein